MAIDFASDLSEMFSDDDHGVSAVFGGDTIYGILDNAYEDVLAGGTVPFAMTYPHFSCRTADVPAVSNGSTITINSIAYTVRNVEPDSTGMTLLVLEAP